MEIKTYTAKEAEKILHVTSKTIRGYIKAGKLKAVKIGRSWVIKEADLMSFINENS